MKYDPAKAYPHPVLRPSLGAGAGDYPRAEFEVTPDARRIEGTTAVRIEATFALSDPDLLELVEEGAAEYVLLVRAAASHHRSAHRSREPAIAAEYGNGELAGRTEVRGLLVAVGDVRGFRADGWHSDYEGLSFDLQAGSVLAEDEPRDYWIDNAEEADVGSIFEVAPESGLGDGQWRCDLAGHRVSLRMSPDDCRRFGEARGRVNGTPEAAHVMNAVYLPALVWVLGEADRGEDYADRRWRRSLDARLEECGRRRLGGHGADRLADAQRLLEAPFGAALALLSAEAR